MHTTHMYHTYDIYIPHNTTIYNIYMGIHGTHMLHAYGMHTYTCNIYTTHAHQANLGFQKEKKRKERTWMVVICFLSNLSKPWPCAWQCPTHRQTDHAGKLETKGVPV